MSSRRADLYPPLGINGGPCKVVNRILQNVKNVRDQEALIREVENNVSLTNAQSAIVYPTINKERGAPPFTPLHFTSHSQYRMDLRGITVPDVQESIGRFRDVAERAMAKRDTRVMDKFRADPRFDDSKNNLSVVTGPQRDHLNIVSVFPFPFTPDPKAPPGGCPRPKKSDYRAPAGDLAGVHTFVSEKPFKGIYEPLGDTVEHLPGESPKSDRSRAKPQRTDTRENLERHTPANAVFNTPGPSEPGQKIHVRSPGTPGEDYGHPFKLNIMPRRTEAALYPSYSEKQRSQKGLAKKYYKKYYLRHKSKMKAKAKRKYLRNKNKATFKKEKHRRNSQKYGWRFKRLPAGGYRSNADRARDTRKKKKSTGLSVPFTHPNYGAGNVLDVRDQEVLIEQTDPMGGETLGTGTVPFFTFLHGVDFDTEEGLEAFFDLADADFNDEDPDDVESLRLATFYRETFRPGDNLDPGDGVRDLGEPSPYSPTLPYPDTDRNNRAPAEMMNNISPTDNNPGSAKVIPSGHGFVNKEASAIRVAAKMAEILQGMDPGIQSRSLGINPKLQRSDVGNIIYSFKVPGSKGETYTVKVKGLPPSGSVRTLSKMDLKLSCSCDFWQYQGPEHWAKAGDYLYGKPRGTAAEPGVKDPGGKNRLCKHALATLGIIKKWPAFGKR